MANTHKRRRRPWEPRLAFSLHLSIAFSLHTHTHTHTYVTVQLRRPEAKEKGGEKVDG